MKYAVVRTGGKQYKVCEGDTLLVERLTGKEKEEVLLNDVLLYVSEGVVKVGNPNVKDIAVTAHIIGHNKGEKIRVAKFKAKARYRRVRGHRQLLTKIKILSIGEKKVLRKEENKMQRTEKVVKK